MKYFIKGQQEVINRPPACFSVLMTKKKKGKPKPKQTVELGFASFEGKNKIHWDRFDSNRKFPGEAEGWHP